MNITKEEALEKIEESKKFVQNYDNQDKTKEAEEWFLSILKDLKDAYNYNHSVVCHNSEGEWMIQNMKNGKFYLSYERIWRVLHETYGMDYDEFQDFTKTMLIKHLNWKEEITVSPGWVYLTWLIKDLNWKIKTTSVLWSHL